MQKISNERLICSIMGCSEKAEEGSSPPCCTKHAMEKTASTTKEYGLKAVAEMSEQLWEKNNNVH